MLQSESPVERRWNRHKIDIRLKVTAALADGTEISIFGRGNTMSQGGIGAYIPASLSPGAPVSLELTFPYSDNEVLVKAVVRSCEGFRYGLEFVELPREIQQDIVKSCIIAGDVHFSA
ncbi:MAG: PilZ domain-containing protein [Acidobacteriia bacterium]|nr:PilZ domain-containing protein [Terriglobia bacterium]